MLSIDTLYPKNVPIFLLLYIYIYSPNIKKQKDQFKYNYCSLKERVVISDYKTM